MTPLRLLVALCLLVVAGVSNLSAEAEPTPTDDVVPLTERPTEKLRVAQDLRIDTILSDPLVANPLYLTFDERGRLWLVEYRQYPRPAGLRLLNDDSLARNVYDPPFPPPPPHARDSPFRGKDRVSIHEDTNGDGTFDKHSVFLDGLNLCTAALPGRGGVFVLNPPYLLFYPDADGDDVPDRDPDLLLSGFGIEDSHSITNSLRWGPDGWIYATHGSTVTARVRRHAPDGSRLMNEPTVDRAGQFVWRYHPETRRFEVFAEGGGNAFGVEFDDEGRLYSGHNGGDTRGFHYVQGGYYRKSFGKHGPLSNPYAYGYLPAMKHPPVERFTHTFEIYEADTLPERYHGSLIGLAPHRQYIIQSRIFDWGSTRQTEDIQRIATPDDQSEAGWFSPVDIQTGPDGCLYVADWLSRNVKHYAADAGETDADRGRVLRIAPATGWRPEQPMNLAKRSTRELVTEDLYHSNRQRRETALRLLYDRKDRSVIPILQEQLRDESNTRPHWTLWALNACVGLDMETAAVAVHHPSPAVRRWVLRLLFDSLSEYRARFVGNPAVHIEFLKAVEAERTPSVLVQWMAALRGETDLSELDHFVSLDVEEDPFLPLMLWWTFESYAGLIPNDDPVYWLREDDRWALPLARQARLLPRYLRLLADRDAEEDVERIALLLEMVDSSATAMETELTTLITTLDESWSGRALDRLPESLAFILRTERSPAAFRILVRSGDEETLAAMLGTLTKHADSESRLIQWLPAICDRKPEPTRFVPLLHKALRETKNAALTKEVLLTLQAYGDASSGTVIVASSMSLPASMRPLALSILGSRPAWHESLMTALDEGSWQADQIPEDVRRRLLASPTTGIAERAVKLFPKVELTPDQIGDRINTLTATLNTSRGDVVRGREVFMKAAACGKCHRLGKVGGKIGPDLTAYNLRDTRHILYSILAPSAEIREGYETRSVATEDGQLVTGFRVAESPQTVTLRNAEGVDIVVRKSEIEADRTSKESLMPAGLLDRLTDRELQDLFAFLRADRRNLAISDAYRKLNESD